jgi:hypothetical protein
MRRAVNGMLPHIRNIDSFRDGTVLHPYFNRKAGPSCAEWAEESILGRKVRRRRRRTWKDIADETFSRDRGRFLHKGLFCGFCGGGGKEFS